MHFKSTAALLLASVAAVALGATSSAHAADVEVVQEKPKQKAKIRPGRKNVDLQVYGQVNQAFLFADSDAGPDRTDIVDNDNASSRFGFRGQYKYGDWFSGVRIEFNAEVNTTDELNFDTDDSLGIFASDADGESDQLSLRWAHWHIGNKSLGTLNFGFTEEATQGVSERDLSGTTIIAEADVDDIGGEFQFGNSFSPVLGTSFEVDDFFNDLDGGRDTAVAYHTPKWKIGPGTFQVRAAGRVEDEVEDDPDDAVQFLPSVAAFYKGELPFFGLDGSFVPWEFDAAIGYRREEDASASAGDFDVDGNVVIGSISILAPFGTNFTFGAGAQFFEASSPGATTPEDETFFYIKGGQRFDWFDFGETRFSVDAFFGEQVEDFSIAGDDIQSVVDAFSIGGGVVQVVKPLGVELYAAARFYDVEFEDLQVGTGPGALAPTAAQITEAFGGPEATAADLFFFFTGARVRF